MKRVLDRLNSLEITGTSDHILSGDVVEIFARLPKFSSDPGPETGIIIWVNTTEEKLKVRNSGEVFESVLTKSGKYLSHYILEDTDFSRATLTNASLSPLGRIRLGVSSSLGSGAIQIEAVEGPYGNFIFFILKPNGDVWAWGYNNRGQLGLDKDAEEVFEWDPHKTLFSNIKQISTSGDHTLALSNTDVLWGVGSNFYYEISPLTEKYQVDQLVPIQVATSVKDMIALMGATVIVKNDGTVWYCGQARNGRSGLSPFFIGELAVSNVRYLTRIPGLENIVSITKWGEECLVALDDNGDIWVWGALLNQYSVPGIETSLIFKLGSGMIESGSPTKLLGIPKIVEIGQYFLKDTNGNYCSYITTFADPDYSMSANILVRSPLEAIEKPYNYFSRGAVVTQSGEVWTQ